MRRADLAASIVGGLLLGCPQSLLAQPAPISKIESAPLAGALWAPQTLPRAAPAIPVAAPTHYNPAPVFSHQQAAPETLPTPADRVTGPQPLTLNEVIQGCLLGDPVLRAGIEAVRQASGDAVTASLAPNPIVNASQTLNPLNRNFTPIQQGGPPQLDIGLQYPVDWFLFGKRAAAMRAAGAGVRVSEADYADLVRLRVLQAAEAYYTVLEAKGLVDLAQQDVDNLRQIEGVTQRAVEGGGRPQVELNRVRLDRLRSEQTLRNSEYARIAALASLRALLGLVDDQSVVDVAGNLDFAVPATAVTPDEAFAQAEANRPDVEGRRWAVDQARKTVVLENRRAYPEVVPSVGFTRQFQTDIGYPDANSWGAGFDSTLPLANRNQGNRMKAASVMIQREHELQARLVAVRAEVEQAVFALRTAVANSQAVADEQLTLARDVRESLNRAYEAGGRPLLDVLDAQRNYRETYRLYITSRADYGRAVVRLDAALGKRY
jgi:cobalt-zinc-cadmium efflux system outer membrane protein